MDFVKYLILIYFLLNINIIYVLCIDFFRKMWYNQINNFNKEE